MVFVVGAFDWFADAKAAAMELRDSGLVPEDVEVIPDRAEPSSHGPAFCAGRRWPGTLEKFVRGAFDLDEEHYLRRPRVEPVRRGSFVVSVPVHDAYEGSIARAMLHRHRAVELESVTEDVIH